MKKSILLFAILLTVFESTAQIRIREKKYPSLLWEISGKGMARPSYLIGTMHVSSKLAFHLPDSFYIALKNAQVVALETNPETWQEDMSKYDLGGNYDMYRGYGGYSSIPEDYLSINTLKFFKYETRIENALYSNPSSINNLLYRSYGNDASDFEEDTYLDMYIYQCGKKWGKKVAGVENYGESMKLMMEAYRDAAKDKNRKERSYSDADDDYSAVRLQEAYRTGNLDLLDSINKYNSISEAFDEKFLYQRNDIQARSIDSILRSGSTLFVGVGAAHLPGDRGVIEILRKKGYRVRPVKMGERASRQKDLVDKLRVPVSFKTVSADDGFYKVDIPGKFYRFGDNLLLDQQQYADMANGSYYMVTRVMTNAWMWGHDPGRVYNTVDSLLYENIPGKIISKSPITRNGFKGLDITNRTRRGDLQRYHIFITPFEILFFKMSGNGDYVKDGEEARRFFGSIQLRPYNGADSLTNGWIKYSPSFGGFAVDLPHEPYLGNDGSWIVDAMDKTTGTVYRVIRSDIHNYNFVEEDSFDLSLMEESFMASEFIETQLSRRFITHKGYPALDATFRDKQGGIYLARFIIRGPHYYTLIARGHKESPRMKKFMDSFELRPFRYPVAKSETDTSLYFTVKTHVYEDDPKIRLDMPIYNYYAGGSDDEEDSEDELLAGGAYRNRVFEHDSTGEKIYVSFRKSSRYFYSADSSLLEKNRKVTYMGDSTWIVRSRTRSEWPDGTLVWETQISDTGSSRLIRARAFYRDGISFTLLTQADTLSAPSDFVKTFFDSFTPADTLKGVNPFVKKADLFFADFMSPDSVLRKRAVKNLDMIVLDSADLPGLKKAIGHLSWEEKNYLETKEALIGKLGKIKSRAASDYLRELYYKLEDTIQLQYPVLEGLLDQQTTYSFGMFRDIVTSEPPVLHTGAGDGTADVTVYPYTNYINNSGREGDFMDELFDTLQLTKTILPDLLPLLDLDDYEEYMMRLLGRMADSNLISRRDYESYFSKFLIQAKQELRKQAIAEKMKSIRKAEESKQEKKNFSYYPDNTDQDNGNRHLSLYATLLLPWWDSHPGVQALVGQMLKSDDKRLKYNILLLMIRNNRPYPDTMLTYFAGQDEYRYELYSDLREIKKTSLFPVKYNNHLDLGRSSLLNKKSSNTPDSLIYVNRVKTAFREKTGYVYFFRYKEKKDDINWKLATVGLVPEDPGQFEFEETVDEDFFGFDYQPESLFGFTRFTDTKFSTDEPVMTQLKKELKKILLTKRKSGRGFYNERSAKSFVAPDYYD